MNCLNKAERPNVYHWWYTINNLTAVLKTCRLLVMLVFVLFSEVFGMTEYYNKTTAELEARRSSVQVNTDQPLSPKLEDDIITMPIRFERCDSLWLSLSEWNDICVYALTFVFVCVGEITHLRSLQRCICLNGVERRSLISLCMTRSVLHDITPWFYHSSGVQHTIQRMWHSRTHYNQRHSPHWMWQDKSQTFNWLTMGSVVALHCLHPV